MVPLFSITSANQTNLEMKAQSSPRKPTRPPSEICSPSVIPFWRARARRRENKRHAAGAASARRGLWKSKAPLAASKHRYGLVALIASRRSSRLARVFGARAYVTAIPEDDETDRQMRLSYCRARREGESRRCGKAREPTPAETTESGLLRASQSAV